MHIEVAIPYDTDDIRENGGGEGVTCTTKEKKMAEHNGVRGGVSLGVGAKSMMCSETNRQPKKKSGGKKQVVWVAKTGLRTEKQHKKRGVWLVATASYRGLHTMTQGK